MNKKNSLTAIIFLVFMAICLLISDHRQGTWKPTEIGPNDWFLNQRAHPQGEIRFEGYQRALRQSRQMKLAAAGKTGSWESAGPTNIGGRISDVEMSPTGFDTIYAGAASGGVYLSNEIRRSGFGPPPVACEIKTG